MPLRGGWGGVGRNHLGDLHRHGCRSAEAEATRGRGRTRRGTFLAPVGSKENGRPAKTGRPPHHRTLRVLTKMGKSAEDPGGAEASRWPLRTLRNSPPWARNLVRDRRQGG